LGIYTTGILLFAASLFAQQPSGTVSTGTSTRKTQITPKDLAVGNRFFYNINGKRLVEEVVAKRTIGERVYAVLRSTPGSMERLERSDERGVYEYHSGSEQCIVSFEAAVNDSLPWTDGTDYTNRSAMLYLREINKQEVFGAQVQAFSGNYRFRQGGMTGGGMYAERFGFVGAMLFGSSSRTNRSVQLRGAVLRGQTFGDVSTTSPPRLKKAPTALFSRTMQTGITPNMNIQLYVPDTTLISLWIFTKQNRLVRKVLDNTISAIMQFRETLNVEAVDRAIELLRRAKRVEFYAMGNSAVVALDAQHKLFRFRVPSVAHTDGSILGMAAELLGPEDVAVFVSSSGQPPELARAAGLAVERGAAVIAITAGQSPLARRSTVCIPVEHSEDVTTFVSMISRILHLLVVDMLSVGLAVRRAGVSALASPPAAQQGSAEGQVQPAPGVLISHIA